MTACNKSVSLGSDTLDRDVFMRTLIRELSGTLENVVGLEEASGYISVVGLAIGQNINQSYKRALLVDRLDRAQVADVLVDLKRRIAGDFYIIEESDERIVWGTELVHLAIKSLGVRLCA